MKINKSLAVISLVGAMSLGTVVGAVGASNTQEISALLNFGIKIKYNGQEKTLTDASGQKIVPITYNGTTYLPVRAVSDLINLPVGWDANTNTVLLGENQVQPANLVDLPKTSTDKYIDSKNSFIVDSAELTVSGSDANETFKNGIKYSMEYGNSSSDFKYTTLFDVKDYKELTFTAYADTDTTAILFDENGNMFAEFEVKANTLVPKTLDITKASKISFSGKCAPGEKGFLKIYNPTVK